jgi:hypothetical protein
MILNKDNRHNWLIDFNIFLYFYGGPILRSVTVINDIQIPNNNNIESNNQQSSTQSHQSIISDQNTILRRNWIRLISKFNELIILVIKKLDDTISNIKFKK